MAVREKEKIFVAERYQYIEKKLIEIDDLIKKESSPAVTKAKYKDFKNWAKEEYNKTHKATSMGEYIDQWYGPLITDIYVQSFCIANVNASMSKIELAIWNAIDYFHHYKSDFVEYADNDSKQ